MTTQRLLACAALLASLAALVGCSGGHDGPTGPPPTEVTISETATAPVEDDAEFKGHVEATDVVDIKAQVTGYLMKVNFKEGDMVEKDQVLYEIDPQIYDADLAKAKADGERFQATLARLRRELDRARQVSAGDAISRTEYDKIAAGVDETRATLAAAKAVVARKQIDRKHCDVRSPIKGRISRTRVTVGNLINENSTLLTTVVSVDPIYAYFDVDERTVLRVQELIRKGEFDGAAEGKKLPVYLGTQRDLELQRGGKYKGFPHKGYIDFVDNRVDAGTGNLLVRGVFKNPVPAVRQTWWWRSNGNGSKAPPLSPGLFVRVRVPIGNPSKMVVVPDSAFGSDQGQRYVFVVNTETNKVEQRKVRAGDLRDGKRPVEEGLKPGEWIITEGLQRVRNGSIVQPTRGPMPDR